jgi:hypothetical protein
VDEPPAAIGIARSQVGFSEPDYQVNLIVIYPSPFHKRVVAAWTYFQHATGQPDWVTIAVVINKLIP